MFGEFLPDGTESLKRHTIGVDTMIIVWIVKRVELNSRVDHFQCKLGAVGEVHIVITQTYTLGVSTTAELSA